MADLPSARFEKNYFDQELQKIAKAVADKWLVLTLTWKDIHTEACLRLAMRKGEAPIGNLKGFYYGLCNNYCQEVYRGMGELIDPVELLLLEGTSNKPYVWELLINMLYEFGFPCGLLLFLFYLAEPPIKDKETLFRIAVFFGAKLHSPRPY